MDGGYTDTILLDCSRPASEEAKANNNVSLSQYTNKLGAGVHLNAGDKVSVHSGFVSELGCGADTIEFLGRDLKHEYTVKETKLTKTQSYWSQAINGTTETQAPYGDLAPFNAHCVEYKEQVNTYQLVDNEAHLSVSYYKNANGEGYFHLPRRFGFKAKAEWDLSNRKITDYQWADQLFSEGKKVATAQFDSYLNGRCMNNWNLPVYQNRTDLKDYRFGGVPSVYNPYPAPTQATTKMFKKRNENQRYTIFVKALTYYGQRTPSGNFPPDVSKISSVAYGDQTDTDNKSSSRDDFKIFNATWHPRDPSTSEFIQYKEDLKITTKVGYSSPASLGQDITDQMNVRGEMKYLKGTSGGRYGRPSDKKPNGDSDPFSQRLETGLQQVDVSVSADTTLYKTFGCASPFTFNKPAYDTWIGNTVIPAGNLITDHADYIGLNYINSYQTIGVKRPELFTTGREVAKTADLITSGSFGVGVPTSVGESPLVSWRNRLSCQMLNMVAYDDRYTAEIQTSWAWTEKNLLLLKEWFSAQGRDETLFGNTEASANISSTDVSNQSQFKKEGSRTTNSRFIHMNPYQTAENDISIILGDDNYEAVPNVTPTADASFKNNSTAPMFIYYDESRDDATDGGETDANQRYGLFMKRTVTKSVDSDGNVIADAGTYDVIAFSTRLIGGISEQFFNKTGRPTYPHVAPLATEDGYYLNGRVVVVGIVSIPRLAYNVLLGSDTHFSAYGTDAICLYTGMLEGEANDSNAPGVTYFADSGDGGVLNSSEAYIQSYFNRLTYVGAEDPTLNFDSQGSRFNFENLHTSEHTGNVFNAGDPGFAIDADASAKVYFLNKRLRKVSFCPDMRPYPEYATINFVAGEKKFLSVFNENLHSWTVFDADSGIFIDDFNCPEDKFASSLFGILGFTYDQFSKKNKTYNRQFRINDIINTTEQMGAITTNSNVDAQDLRGFRANMWGAEFFNSQIPIILANDGATPDEKYPFCPLVSKVQVSASIEASQLPTKMLSPYYVIRSNIIGDYNYLGGPDGGQSLPSVYIVNKENGFGDFFFQSESQTEFTITKPYTLTSVKTSVHNPDFTLASVSPNTSIIYKVTKMNSTPLNIAEQVLNDAKKSKS